MEEGPGSEICLRASAEICAQQHLRANRQKNLRANFFSLRFAPEICAQANQAAQISDSQTPTPPRAHDVTNALSKADCRQHTAHMQNANACSCSHVTHADTRAHVSTVAASHTHGRTHAVHAQCNTHALMNAVRSTHYALHLYTLDTGTAERR